MTPSSSLSCRAANLYVSMNEGLTFISSSVTITTVGCVSSLGPRHTDCVYMLERNRVMNVSNED